MQFDSHALQTDKRDKDHLPEGVHSFLQMLRAQMDGCNYVCLCIATQAGLQHMSQFAVPVGNIVFALGAARLVMLRCAVVCMLLLVCQGCDGVPQHEQPMVDLGSLLLPADQT